MPDEKKSPPKQQTQAPALDLENSAELRAQGLVKVEFDGVKGVTSANKQNHVSLVLSTISKTKI